MAGPKAWEFLLPDTGNHQVLVEKLGEPDQRMFIDGVAQPGTSLMCEGPGGSILELHRHSSGAWQLLVNGFVVEDYRAGSRQEGDESLRSLKSMPEGSYMIAPQLEATGLSSNIVQEFVFLAYGQKHSVQVALTGPDSLFQLSQPQAVWEIIFDGHLVERHSGDDRGTNADVQFSVSLDGASFMAAVLKIMWFRWALPAHYKYRLTFGGVDVPPFEGPSSPAGRMIAGIQNMPVILASESSLTPAILVAGVECEYLVDNRQLRSSTQGLCHRFSKDVENKNEVALEPWGTTVIGVAEDDGWVKVGEEYLPFFLDGLPVLTLLQAGDTLEEEAKGSLDASADGQPRSPGVDPDSLPQGVSLIRQTGRYQATIRSKTGRWVDLGEYGTVEEAHQRYLEAMPVHNPSKAVAPSIS